MKKLAYILAAAAIMLCGCNKDDASTSEVGKWYAYNFNEEGTVYKNDIAIVLDLKADKTVDFIITAWGDRWQGTYTYDGKEVKITWNKYMGRPAATSDYWETVNRIPVAPENIYKDWNPFDPEHEENFNDPNQFGSVISVPFTFKGDSGTIPFVGREWPAERQKK